MASLAISKAVSGIQSVLVHFQTVAAGVANRALFRLPQKSKIVRVGASYRVSNASDLQIMVEAGGVDLLSAALDAFPLAVPTAPTAALAGLGAGNVNNGTHSYKVTFVNALGESIPGPKSNVITTVGGDGQVAVSAIPVGPSGTTSRKLYRTVAGDAGNHKLLATIANNTATTYADNTADGGLGADAPTVDTRMAGDFYEGSLAAAAESVAKEAEITVDVDTLTGTDVKDLCVQIDLVRLD